MRTNFSETIPLRAYERGGRDKVPIRCRPDAARYCRHDKSAPPVRLEMGRRDQHGAAAAAAGRTRRAAAPNCSTSAPNAPLAVLHADMRKSNTSMDTAGVRLRSMRRAGKN